MMTRADTLHRACAREFAQDMGWADVDYSFLAPADVVAAGNVRRAP